MSCCCSALCIFVHILFYLVFYVWDSLSNLSSPASLYSLTDFISTLTCLPHVASNAAQKFALLAHSIEFLVFYVYVSDRTSGCDDSE